MPYFVFGVRPFAQIEKLAEFADFKQASTHAKALRAAQAMAVGVKIKVMFADNEQLAEELLSQVREPGPSGDD
jgi:hypothetical protein